MIYLVLVMVFILLVSGAIVAYVAYPHRGEKLPGVPRLGDAMSKAVDRMPTLDETEEAWRPLGEQVKDARRSVASRIKDRRRPA